MTRGKQALVVAGFIPAIFGRGRAPTLQSTFSVIVSSSLLVIASEAKQSRKEENKEEIASALCASQ